MGTLTVLSNSDHVFHIHVEGKTVKYSIFDVVLDYYEESIGDPSHLKISRKSSKKRTDSSN